MLKSKNTESQSKVNCNVSEWVRGGPNPLRNPSLLPLSDKVSHIIRWGHFFFYFFMSNWSSLLLRRAPFYEWNIFHDSCKIRTNTLTKQIKAKQVTYSIVSLLVGGIFSEVQTLIKFRAHMSMWLSAPRRDLFLTQMCQSMKTQQTDISSKRRLIFQTQIALVIRLVWSVLAAKKSRMF